MAHHKDWESGPALLGFAVDEVNVGNDDVGTIAAVGEVTALAEGVESTRSFSNLAAGESVAEVVVTDDSKAALGEFGSEGVVAVDVLFHAVDELEDSAGCAGGFPRDVVELLRGVGGGDIEFVLSHDADGFIR